MDQVNAILDTARAAQPNTTLQNDDHHRRISPALRDTRNYYREDDIRFIVRHGLAVVPVTLMFACGDHRTAVSGWVRDHFCTSGHSGWGLVSSTG